MATFPIDETVPQPVALPETIIVIPASVYVAPRPAVATQCDGGLQPPLSFRPRPIVRHMDSLTAPYTTPFRVPIDDPTDASRIAVKPRPIQRYQDLLTSPFATPFRVPIDEPSRVPFRVKPTPSANVSEYLRFTGNTLSMYDWTNVVPLVVEKKCVGPAPGDPYIAPAAAVTFTSWDDFFAPVRKPSPRLIQGVPEYLRFTGNSLSMYDWDSVTPGSIGRKRIIPRTPEVPEYLRFIGNTLAMYDWSNAKPFSATAKRAAPGLADPYIAAAVAATFTNWGDFFAPLRPSRFRQSRLADQDFFRFIHTFAYWAKTDVVMPVRVKQRFAHYLIAEYLRFENNIGQHLWKLPSKSVDFKAGTSDPSVSFSLRGVDRTVRFTKEQ